MIWHLVRSAVEGPGGRVSEGSAGFCLLPRRARRDNKFGTGISNFYARLARQLTDPPLSCWKLHGRLSVHFRVDASRIAA